MRRAGSFESVSRISMKRFLALLALALAGCGRAAPPPPAPPVPAATARIAGVRLLVVVVVDQLAADTLERGLAAGLDGGLARLAAEGVSFAEAHHRHAFTTTAPGHAALASGLDPARSGIVHNGWYDRASRKWVAAVDDPAGGKSAARLEADTLADWIARRDPGARIFAASGKDRGAILLGGRTAGTAFWFDPQTGNMTSSRHYPGGRPEWLARFNARRLADRPFGTLWRPVADPEAAARFGVVELPQGVFPDRFPHALGEPTTVPDEDYYDQYFGTPHADELLAEFARTLIAAEGLGEDDALDVLGLSFSALDAAGHEYGPHSAEVWEVVAAVDRTLAGLLEFLDERVGRDHLAVALSADHGVAPLPEVEQAAGRPGHREDAAEIACLQAAGRRFEEELGEGLLAADRVFDRAALRRAGVGPEDAETRLAVLLEECPTVARAWTRASAAAAAAAGDPKGAAYARSFHPDRGRDVLVERRPGVLDERGRRTTHGTPERYDTHVPLILRLPGVAPRRIDTPVATVDLAPTLAALLGVPAPEGLDGVDRSDLVLTGR